MRLFIDYSLLFLFQAGKAKTVTRTSMNVRRIPVNSATVRTSTVATTVPVPQVTKASTVLLISMNVPAIRVNMAGSVRTSSTSTRVIALEQVRKHLSPPLFWEGRGRMGDGALAHYSEVLGEHR